LHKKQTQKLPSYYKVADIFQKQSEHSGVRRCEVTSLAKTRILAAKGGIRAETTMTISRESAASISSTAAERIIASARERIFLIFYSY